MHWSLFAHPKRERGTTSMCGISRDHESCSARQKGLLKKVFGDIVLLCLSTAMLGQGVQQSQPASALKRSAAQHRLPITKFYDTPVPPPPGKPGELIRSAPFGLKAQPVEAVRILYYSRSGGGELVADSGVVLFPEGKTPTGGWPVIGWAHPLDGVARSCAPSLTPNLLPGPFLSMYVNLGYAVVATDYTGLGTNFRNAAGDMRSNAMDVMYSIAAARSAVPSLGSRWVAMGTGEGARAAIEISELTQQMPDANYLGSVAISQISDLTDLLQPSGNQSHELPLLLAYGIKTAFPQFDPKDILTEQALPLYRQFEQECEVSEADKIPVAGMLTEHWESNKFVQDYFARNRLGTAGMGAPLLVIDSEGDPYIMSTAKVVTRLCKQGNKVLFNRYAEYDSGQVIGDSVRDQMAWIQERFAGKQPRTNCAGEH